MSLSAGYLSFRLVTGAETALGTLAGCFALLTGALAMAFARRSRDQRLTQPVRFVSHAYLMAALLLATMAMLFAFLLSMLRR